MNSTQQNIKLLEENEADMARQAALQKKIVEIEKQLKLYKTSLGRLNQKMDVNVTKIVQSQREMIVFQNHLKKFEMSCKQVGTIVHGESYR